jgi:hypothetical protein
MVTFLETEIVTGKQNFAPSHDGSDFHSVGKSELVKWSAQQARSFPYLGFHNLSEVFSECVKRRDGAPANMPQNR